MPENSAIKPTDDSSTHIESRQDKLKAWLAGQGLGLKQLSDRIGVSRQGVLNMLNANSIHPWRYPLGNHFCFPWAYISATFRKSRTSSRWLDSVVQRSVRKSSAQDSPLFSERCFFRSPPKTIYRNTVYNKNSIYYR